MARKRLRSDAYKMEHQKKGNLTNLYMKEARATDATRLEAYLSQSGTMTRETSESFQR